MRRSEPLSSVGSFPHCRLLALTVAVGKPRRFLRGGILGAGSLEVGQHWCGRLADSLVVAASRALPGVLSLVERFSARLARWPVKRFGNHSLHFMRVRRTPHWSACDWRMLPLWTERFVLVDTIVCSALRQYLLPVAELAADAHVHCGPQRATMLEPSPVLPAERCEQPQY